MASNTSIYSIWNRRGRKPAPYTGRSATLIPAPARPPTGYYDPSIDAQVAAGQRGLGDLRIDTDTGHRRGLEDLTAALGNLDLSQTRAGEDYQTQTGDLNRNFASLARQQAEHARAQGILSGGLQARAGEVRQANQARSQGLLDRAKERTFADIANQRTLTQRSYDRQYGAGGDIDLTLARAEREQPLLESDANQLRLAQAIGAGYVPTAAHYKFGPVPRQPRRRRRPRGGGIGEG